MGVVHETTEASANGCDVKADMGRSFGVKFDVDPDWFAQAAQGFYPAKGGTELHYLTDYDERLCQKYVAGTVKPSAYFLRTLLRSPHGPQWLAAIMGNTPWWLEHQRAADIGRQVLNITK